MSLFRKLFGSKSGKESARDQVEERSKYMPEIELPVEERFTINFKANGGKFRYCENQNEVENDFQHILIENDWEKEKVLILDDRLAEKFEAFSLNITKIPSEARYFFTTCEYLIGNDGSLLISSNQIAEKKLKELPLNFVIFATTSQFIENISEGLHGIKNRNRDKIPTNITTIKHFKSSDEGDFLSYGSSTKNLYLLLLEDL